MPERDGYAPQGRIDLDREQVNESGHDPSEYPENRDFDIYHVRRVVAGNPNTPAQVLFKLAEDGLAAIRRRVAENQKTPPEALVRLSEDSDPDVRLAVAENPNSPPELLARLAGDDDVDVRYGVAENPHMPEEILLKLSDDENPYVRCRALKTLQMLAPDVQSRLKLMMQPGYGTYRWGY